MATRRQPKKFVYTAIALTLAIMSGCSPEFHKDDADKEVYNIIDHKWRAGFGEKANYIVSDSNLADQNEIKITSYPVAPETMSLAQAVGIATANSRNYQARKENLYLNVLSLTGERYKYAVQWFATVDVGYSKSGESTEDIEAGAEFGARKTILTPEGIIASSALKINWSRFLTGDPRITLASILTADVIVPLLGGGGGKADWENLTQAERDVLYGIREFNRFRQTFVVDTINAYYGVLQQRDTVTNAQNNYQRVLESQDRLEMEAEAGRRTRIDVDEARQNVLRAQESVVSTRQRYERTLDDFKFRLAIATDANIELDQNELAALKEMGVTEPTFALDEAIETALVSRLDLANSTDKIDDNLRKAKLAAEGLGPQLNVKATIEAASPDEETDFERIRFHEGDYTVGFDADLPFDRKNQRNAYRTSLINLERQKRQYAADVDSVKLEVRDAYRRLIQTAEQYRIQDNSLKLATQRVESNRLLLDAGRVTVRILLESQDSLVNAENAVTAALIEHLNAKLSFYRDVGILHVKPDGMWAQIDTFTGNTKNDRERQKSRLIGAEENL
ncbi:MAG: TolC family protein [Sedimentisphaerales bacterium]|nr:TolC family protein [Sedimentisphaerales bacterium]